jgi:hypothetical protein
MPQNKHRQNELLESGGQIRGFPGYRTRDNRSGLDPLDSRAEAAFMQGTFFRNLYTFRLRTRNPFYLALMFIFGVVPFLGSIALALATFSVSATWLILILPSLITIPLSINFVLSLLQMMGVIPPLKSIKPIQENAKRKNKKLPKRRKDFR